jgi:hypothetical protein
MIVVDVEASSLYKGYPIEVAWASDDGRIGAYLIKPTERWARELIWHPDSGKVHKLRSETCWTMGNSVEEVAMALNRDLAGKTVRSDGPEFDFRWLTQLRQEAGINQFSFDFARDDIEISALAIAQANKVDGELLRYILYKRDGAHTHAASSDAASWIAAIASIQSQGYDVATRGSLQIVDGIFLDWARKAAAVCQGWRPRMPVKADD